MRTEQKPQYPAGWPQQPAAPAAGAPAAERLQPQVLDLEKALH